MLNLSIQAVCQFANQLLTGLRIAKEHHIIDFSESTKCFIYFMILLLLKLKFIMFHKLSDQYINQGNQNQANKISYLLDPARSCLNKTTNNINFLHPGNSALFSVLLPLYFSDFLILFFKLETSIRNITFSQIYLCIYKFWLQKMIVLFFNRSPTHTLYHWMYDEQEIILVWPHMYISLQGHNFKNGVLKKTANWLTEEKLLMYRY